MFPASNPNATWLIFSPYRYEGRVFRHGSDHLLYFQASTYVGLAGAHLLAGRYGSIDNLQAKINQFSDGHNWRIAKLTPGATPSQIIVSFHSEPIGQIEYDPNTHTWQRQDAKDNPIKGNQPEIVLNCIEDPRPVAAPELTRPDLDTFARVGYHAINGIKSHTDYPHQVTPFQFGWVKVEHEGRIAYVKYESALSVSANGTRFNF
ncbi:hypothetical protein ACQ4M3_13105 [Leptolyngbya sp. AN03gr2]